MTYEILAKDLKEFVKKVDADGKFDPAVIHIEPKTNQILLWARPHDEAKSIYTVVKALVKGKADKAIGVNVEPSVLLKKLGMFDASDILTLTITETELSITNSRKWGQSVHLADSGREVPDGFYVTKKEVAIS